MSDIKNLYETIGEKAYRLRLPFPEIPHYISNNLKYGFFDWQKNAFENFLTFQAIKERENPNEPTAEAINTILPLIIPKMSFRIARVPAQKEAKRIAFFSWCIRKRKNKKNFAEQLC